MFSLKGIRACSQLACANSIHEGIENSQLPTVLESCCFYFSQQKGLKSASEKMESQTAVVEVKKDEGDATMKSLVASYVCYLAKPEEEGESGGPASPFLSVQDVWKGFQARLDSQSGEIANFHSQVKQFITNSLFAMENLHVAEGGLFEYKKGHFISIKQAKDALVKCEEKLVEMALEIDLLKQKLKDKERQERQTRRLLHHRGGLPVADVDKERTN